MQRKLPDEQLTFPVLHSPCLLLSRQVAPPCGLFSSTKPSQLSSLPLQVSGVGWISPTQGPQRPSGPQIAFPSLQTPRPLVLTGPL